MSIKQSFFVVCLCVAVAMRSDLASAAQPADAAPTQFVELAVYPAVVSLNHAEDFQQLVAVATRADGVTLDVTKLASWHLAGQADSNDNPFAFEAGKLTASADGSEQLVAEFAGLEARSQLTAKNIATQKPVSYRHDVMPIFLRTNCNSGGCHGSSRGKDGFRLSLFGFDPAGDHHRLTRELTNRRLNFSIARRKPAAAQSDRRRAAHRRQNGWSRRASTTPSCEIGLLPVPPTTWTAHRRSTHWRSTHPKQPSASTVKRKSSWQSPPTPTGRRATSLSWALFQSSNDATAAVNADGLVTSALPGEAFVMARFDTHTVGSQVLVLRTDEQFVAADETPANYIDELVDQKLKTLRIHPSELCGDEEFLRRVTLDIAGRLPTVEERANFLASDYPTKRSKLIDQLLAGPEFSQLWAHKWAELLLIRTENNRVDYKPMYLYWQWLSEQISASRPLDEMIRELLASSGSTFDTPTTNFYQIEPDTKKIAENVAQSFLGTRIQCAQCHNHPFDRWTMDDYYGFTAFFSQLARKRSADYREYMVYNRGSGEMRHPVDRRVMPPKFLGGEAPETKGRDRREVLADWVASPDNPYFAVSVANRIWAHFLGSGIVEPVDDIRISNPPSNPALFERLGKQLVEYDFDTRKLVRDICNSNTYQRACDPNESNARDTANFARAQPRRLSAEVLLDCLMQATGKEEKLPGLPPGSRAVQIADGKASTYFLTTFGRAKRETVCACESTAQPTLSQALHLLNGNTVHQRIAQGKLVKDWLDAKKSPSEVIDEIYLRCLTRHPTDQEQSQLLATLPTEKKNNSAVRWRMCFGPY